MNKQKIYETEKTIEHLRDRLRYCSISSAVNKNVIEMSIEAFKKQIPKKPIDTWESDTERRRHHLCRWACPNCGTFLGFENKHCTECGTKIKWDVIA